MNLRKDHYRFARTCPQGRAQQCCLRTAEAGSPSSSPPPGGGVGALTTEARALLSPTRSRRGVRFAAAHPYSLVSDLVLPGRGLPFSPNRATYLAAGSLSSEG